MVLLTAWVDLNIISIVGRWLRDTMIRYLHITSKIGMATPAICFNTETTRSSRQSVPLYISKCCRCNVCNPWNVNPLYICSSNILQVETTLESKQKQRDTPLVETYNQKQIFGWFRNHLNLALVQG